MEVTAPGEAHCHHGLHAVRGLPRDDLRPGQQWLVDEALVITRSVPHTDRADRAG